MSKARVTTLFLDIGGVLLTNGWDRQSRAKAAKKFSFDLEEMEERHRLIFDTYEIGKISLEEYLDTSLFYKKRIFTQKHFQNFMFAQSQALPKMLALIRKIKAKHALKVVAVNNEGLELMRYRIHTFKLADCIDFFVSSCFVHLRKPDLDIWRLALNISQALPEQVVYIEDRPLLAELAASLGIHTIHHKDYETTYTHLKRLKIG